MKTALILYPNQLFDKSYLPDVHTVFLVEEPLYFGVDQEHPRRLHKQKLILLRASMRRYAEEVLWPLGVEVEYQDLDVFSSSGDILEKVRHFDAVYAFDPIDNILSRRLLQKRREMDNAPAFEFLPNPNFYLKDQEIRQYFSERHTHLFADFYQWQRERFNILIDEDYKPVGGKWMYEIDKPAKLTTDTQLPTFAVYGSNAFVSDAVEYVEKHFPDNPGSVDFVWPTNHEEATEWLQSFLDNRIDNYGKYADTVDGQAPWMYHSAISSSLNLGLLHPKEVVDAALRRHQIQPVPLDSLEAFIRNILGWREFNRGVYLTKHVPMQTSNVFNHQRKLTQDWYEGTTGIPPLDDMIKKVQQRAYAHQVERLMIAGNLMVLCEIQPEHIYQWFSELFIDAYDWVVVPNVYSMSQFSAQDSLTKVPHISSSNYIMQTGDYQRGEWSDIWDGLFWKFVQKHKTVLVKNPAMRTMIQRFERLDADRKRIIGYRAEDFLNRITKL